MCYDYFHMCYDLLFSTCLPHKLVKGSQTNQTFNKDVRTFTIVLQNQLKKVIQKVLINLIAVKNVILMRQ